MHRFNQVGDWLPFDIDSGHDIEQQLLFRSKRLLQRGNILGHAGEQHRLAQLTAHRLSPQVHDDQPLLEKQHQGAD